MDIDKLTGIEFEELCEKLLVNMGYYVETTKASHDGGIDLIAINEEPLIGGKFIVQCKRYIGSVGEPSVRDLYGTLISENANKGVLITTGHFTSSAIAFSKDKQIELIDGSLFKELITKYKLIEESNPKIDKKKNIDYTIGDYVFFGSYIQSLDYTKKKIEWKVLDIYRNKALLISKYALDAKTYHSINRNVRWSECTLRRWLNNEFYNEAFNLEEKSRIISVNINSINSWKKESKVDKDKRDNVFILAPEEALEYFSTSNERVVYPTEYTNSKKITQSVKKYGQACPWILRQSNSRNGSDSCFVNVAGDVFIEKAKESFYEHDAEGSTVRPVIVLAI